MVVEYVRYAIEPERSEIFLRAYEDAQRSLRNRRSAWALSCHVARKHLITSFCASSGARLRTTCRDFEMARSFRDSSVRFGRS